MSTRLDQLSDKMDTRFEQTDRKIDSLASKIDELKRPTWTRRAALWFGRRLHTLTAALLAALGTGVGGYLIGLLIHG